MSDKTTNKQVDTKIDNRNEEDHVSKKHGKWSVARIPRKGWKCFFFEDLGMPAQKCQMCESTMIRYVHHMTHQDYQGVLSVGRVCAEYMEEDPDAAWRRERELKKKKNRWKLQDLESAIKIRPHLRIHWLSMVWRTSGKRNLYISNCGYRIIIRHRFDNWTFTVADEQDDSFVYHSKNNFPSVDEAKLAAYDHITSILIEMRDSINLRKN